MSNRVPYSNGRDWMLSLAPVTRRESQLDWRDIAGILVLAGVRQYTRRHDES